MEIGQYNQYGVVKSYLLCYPVNFKISDKTNVNYNNINYDLLYRQYNNFVNKLIENDIKIRFMDVIDANDQVFTKDIGFVINDTFFISKMKKEDRRIETPILKSLIEENNLKFYEMDNNIEGGDVARHGNIVFIGISTRTTIEGAMELQKELNNRNMDIEVIPIHFDTSKLHLDCVFSTLDENSGVISPYVYDKAIIKKYINNLYEISKEDSDVLGTNLIYLGNKEVFSSNKNVVDMLKSNNYNATFIDYTEIMKAGGSLACSSLVTLRE